MRVRRPLSQVGPAARRAARIRQQNRDAVGRRAHGRCEGCGATDRPLEVSHLFGKGGTGAGLDEHWTSQPELCAALCTFKGGAPGCHQKVDRHLDPDLRDQLRWKAVAALVETYPLPDFWPYPVLAGPITAVREAVRQLEAAGWGWDKDECALILRAS